jgi:NAD(P)-dependent dehydrogenase (short-subunit alcohol dehydrogenase family)
MLLDKRVVVVTGASSGIGRCIALAAAAQGATVCLVARREDRLREVAATIVDAGGDARLYPTDLAEDEQVTRAAEAIVRDFGVVHVLVHCAALLHVGRLDKTPVEEFDLVQRINLRAPYLLTQGLLPHIAAAGGDIVFMNSTAGLAAKGGSIAYAATKHGLKAMADGLRSELSEAGIRVLSVYPARTATPMQELLFELEGRVYQPHLLLQPEEVARTVLHMLTSPRDTEIIDLTIRGVRNMSATA